MVEEIPTKISEITEKFAGIRYFMSLAPNNIKIEPEVYDESHGGKQLRGWRLWINLNAQIVASNNDLEEVYNLPIKLVKGRYLSHFEIVFENNFILQKVYNYYLGHKDDYKYNLSFNEVKDELKKDDSLQEFNFTMLFFPQLTQALSNEQQNVLKLLPPDESELLYLQDFSKINLRLPPKLPDGIDTYLQNMYLSGDEIENIKLFTGLEELDKGERPTKSGIVLYGLPGTGKTHLVEEGLVKIFRDKLGFGFHSIEIGEVLNNPYVGGLASNISDRVFGPAIKMIVDKQKPCFIFVDEASDLLEKNKESESNNWRSQGIEAMKSFVNSKRYPGIILCLATNLEAKKFDDALTRDGRLKDIEIPLPNKNRCLNLWEEYLIPKVLFRKNSKKSFDSDMVNKIAEISAENTNMAFMVSFCNDYYLRNRDKEIIFEDFFKLYVKELKIRIQKEKDRQIDNTESNYALSPKEKEDKKNKIEKEFSKQMHIIDSISQGKEVSFKKIISAPFKTMFKDKQNVKKRYLCLMEYFKNWESFLINSGGNVFDDASLRLISLILTELDFLIPKFFENQFQPLKRDLELIKKHLYVILEINKNNTGVELISDSEIRELMATIEDLKKYNLLFEEDGTSKLIIDGSSNIKMPTQDEIDKVNLGRL